MEIQIQKAIETILDLSGRSYLSEEEVEKFYQAQEVLGENGNED